MRRWSLFLSLLLVSAAAACAEGSGRDDDDGGGAAGGTTGSGGSSTGGGSTTGGGSSTGGGSTSGGGGTGGSGTTGSTTTSGSGGMAPHPVWINELHYDDVDADAGEGVELAGKAGLDLGKYQLELYNGSGAALYDTIALSGSLPDQQGGWGTAWFPVAGLQNGPNDAIALVAKDGQEVVQLLGYEGTMTAADGSAAGMTSIDIGATETNATPDGQSLQLTGSGHSYQSFTWSAPAAATPGKPNNGQTFQ